MAISGICTYLFIIPKIHLMRLRIYFFAIGNAIVLVLPIAISFVDIFYCRCCYANDDGYR